MLALGSAIAAVACASKGEFVGSIPTGRVLQIDARTGAQDEAVPARDGHAGQPTFTSSRTRASGTTAPDSPDDAAYWVTRLSFGRHH